MRAPQLIGAAFTIILTLTLVLGTKGFLAAADVESVAILSEGKGGGDHGPAWREGKKGGDRKHSWNESGGGDRKPAWGEGSGKKD